MINLVYSFTQRFILILTEHLVRCEQHQMDVNTQWFIYATDRLRESLLTVSTTTISVQLLVAQFKH